MQQAVTAKEARVQAIFWQHFAIGTALVLAAVLARALQMYDAWRESH